MVTAHSLVLGHPYLKNVLLYLERFIFMHTRVVWWGRESRASLKGSKECFVSVWEMLGAALRMRPWALTLLIMTKVLWNSILVNAGNDEGDSGTERLSNLAEITQLVKGRTRIPSQHSLFFFYHFLSWCFAVFLSRSSTGLLTSQFCICILNNKADLKHII